MKLIIRCCLCWGRTEEIEVECPKGWKAPDEVETDDAFCPDHKIIKDWEMDVCGGCVGGFGDCDLWRDFTYEEMRLSEKDFEIIASGKCPKRTNGTLFVDTNAGTMETVDLSEIASSESGKAFVQAIKDYRIKVEEYKKRKEERGY